MAHSRDADVPPNDILTLLDTSLPHDLAESTSADLGLGELLDERMRARLDALVLGYGTSRGSSELRASIAESTCVTADDVLVTQGAASGLFLAMFTLCSPGDEIAMAMPQFPPAADMIPAVQAVYGARARGLRSRGREPGSRRRAP